MRPRQPTHSFQLAGQTGWFHDEGFEYGPVHTYDELQLPGPDQRPRKAHVLLPWSYGKGETRYRVVYMNDGQTALFPGGVGPHSWRVAQTLGELMAEDRIEPVIVVALYPVARDHEYTHGPWFPGRAYGGLDTYARYVAEAVKPWVDGAYRTLPGPQHTAVVGSSHGGLAAFYTGGRYPEQFGWVGALSASFWVGRGTNGNDIRSPLADSELMKLTGPVFEDRAKRPRLWIDWGMAGDGSMRGAQEMTALLKTSFGYELDRDLWVYSDAIGGHNEEAWAYRFRHVMETFFARKG